MQNQVITLTVTPEQHSDILRALAVYATRLHEMRALWAAQDVTCLAQQITIQAGMSRVSEG